MNNKTIDKLKALHCCSDAVEWLTKCEARTAQEAWNKCKRGDWMLWLLGKLSGPPESESRKQLVRASCGCARLALKYMKAGEDRPRICIETAEAWADGKATIEQVRQARSAAYAAAAADDAAAAYAAAADDAAAAYAAADAAAADARAKMLNDCAEVVRKFYPKAPKL